MKKEKIEYNKDYVNKPWGYYCTLAQEKGKWNLKTIIITKGEKLSLQKHHLRDEFWIVADGKIKALVDDKTKILNTRDTFYIKKEQKHRAIALEDSIIIELTFGVHDENDIERLEDDYNRI